MDDITFHYDTVLSDVHMLVPNTRHLMTRLNHVGQPVFMSRFKILAERHDNCDTEKGSEKEEEDKTQRETRAKETETTRGSDGEEGGEGNVEALLDEDGDLELTRRPRRNLPEGTDRDPVRPVILKQCGPEVEPEEENADDEAGRCFKDIIRIEHTMATPLEDVGKQVWRGAFLLADFIFSEPDMFRGATVLDLGAGTGLTSIVMATVAKTVYCTDDMLVIGLIQGALDESTDVGEDLLSMCKKNVTLNTHLMEPSGGEVKVRRLDWLEHELCTDADVEFSWTKEEVDDLYDSTSFIIAADVCYDDDLTDALFRTLYQLCSGFSHTCTIFIALEKRMNFTLRHMDVSCEAYNHYVHCLSQLQDLVDGRCSFKVEQLPSDFDQFLQYERIEQLELWKLTSTPLPFEKARSDSPAKP